MVLVRPPIAVLLLTAAPDASLSSLPQMARVVVRPIKDGKVAQIVDTELLPLMVVASILGVWLFSLQHRFETARWRRREDWNASDASLEASSWFGLPRVLHWLTGNIGFHHVHHLNPRVPNYRLGAAHAAVQALWPIKPLSLMSGLRAPRLTLWDEASGRLVGFRDAVRRAS